MQKYLHTGVPGLVRDMDTGVLINTNEAELNQYRAERDRLTQQSNLNKRVNELTDSLDEMKEMLQLLLKSRQDGA